MRRYLYLLLFAVATVQSWAQVVWHDPMKCGYEVVQNQAFVDEIAAYQRLPLRAKDVVRATPFGRLGEADELHGAVVFYASDASKFITGTVLPVDGGVSIFSGV